MPAGSVHIDMKAFNEHRQLQLNTLRKAKAQGLAYFQYHAPYEGTRNEIQETADELIFSDKDWDKLTTAWQTLGIIPFDMGSFMGVSLNVERFNQQAEESKRHLNELMGLVKLSDELPLASIPKDSSGSAMIAAAAGPASGRAQ
jgi:hypothetical protein